MQKRYSAVQQQLQTQESAITASRTLNLHQSVSINEAETRAHLVAALLKIHDVHSQQVS